MPAVELHVTLPTDGFVPRVESENMRLLDPCYYHRSDNAGPTALSEVLVLRYAVSAFPLAPQHFLAAGNTTISPSLSAFMLACPRMLDPTVGPVATLHRQQSANGFTYRTRTLEDYLPRIASRRDLWAVLIPEFYLARFDLELVIQGVEVGVKLAHHAAAILDSLGSRVHMHLVDPWLHYESAIGVSESETRIGDPSEPQEKHDATFATALERLAPYSATCTIIRNFSVPAALQFNDESLDFVYVCPILCLVLADACMRNCRCMQLDAIHQKDAVEADLRAWWPKLKRGGMMAGHDFDRGGVEQAVLAFVGPFPDAVRPTVYSTAVLEEDRSFFMFKAA